MPTTTDTQNGPEKKDKTEISSEIETIATTAMIKSLPNSPSSSSTSTSTESSTSTSNDQTNAIVPIPNDELDILIKMERANK